jgi:hypothetical protein
MARTVSLGLLEQVRIASPCPVRWADMVAVGDGERIRHCDQCNLNVYNFSAMPRAEAEQIVRTHTGRLCAGFYVRPDGTYLIQDCPVALAAVRRRAARVAGRLAAAVVTLLTGGTLLARPRDGAAGLGSREPFATIRRWLAPAPPPAPSPGQIFLGGAAMVPPPPAAPTGSPAAAVLRQG